MRKGAKNLPAHKMVNPINTKHLGGVSAECSRAFYKNPNGPLVARETVVTTHDTSDGKGTIMQMDTWFNNDISSCDELDSGITAM